ncbi:valine--tRNA ligase [Desulfolithobacter dissulfuricans]|uniref:Valine--tRNA ligase n=1 Tax=Desulfolithobacter dissulfuricans TaxID=2795293 RepID=A0A915U8E2_9BACT|nr:valine--tRNA ligase [Desulfolithobacter dissulfuricans]BCO07911.1 valine--tRNA ligase [Desulfolithobacter dissulfuricans]
MSKKYDLPKAYEFNEVEARWYAYWQEHKTFAATMEEGKPSFSIVIPPPNVTGVLHIGHALNNTLQDILVRYHRMKGDNTLWVPGTDHAGIATQNVVERQLATEGKTRHDLGRDKFIERVWQWREEKGGTIINQLKRIGSSCDWDRERFTMDEGLSKAVREVFVRLYNEGLIYKGDYIVNWCPRCHTALADDEVEHDPTDGKLYHIRYPFADGSGHVVVATTRPETMLGDTGVAVHPEDERYQHLKDVGISLPLTDRTIPVVFDRHVQREFGTGALKVTPAHDRDDYEIGLRHNLEILKVMDDHGVMNEAAGRYAGLDRFECRRKIVEDLKEQGFLEKIEDYQHAVGKCYRCSTVVEPITSKQWFVSVRPLADKAVEAVREGKIRIFPNTWYNTFYSWMDNIRDWCISRQIWWGHRIPAWTCQDCGEVIVASEDPDTCPRCGSTRLEQETDVLDTWFSSALWPFSTLGWPENTRELQMFYPTSVLITSFDILFFWVARMMMMGIHFMGEVPFRDVYLHALVRDKHGKKMSKSTGNVIDPLVMIEKYGTDAFRFTLTAFAAQGREIRMDEDRIEGYRHFINKLWNAARFAQMHIKDCDPSITRVVDDPQSLPLQHRWILSRLDKTIGDVRRDLDGYNFNEIASAIYQFTWHEFCDWYVEWIKPELYGEDATYQEQARGVLLTVLENILKLLHPIAPFVTEEIWSVLPGERSTIMLEPFPEVRPEWEDADAEQEMGLLMDVISGIRTIRSEAELHPTAKIEATAICPDPEKRRLIETFSPSIEAMTRAEKLHVTPEAVIPDDAGHALVQDVELFVPLKGLIDVEAELDKLARERTRLEKELKRVEGKLGNEKFLANAPEAVVEKEREKQAELQARLEKNQANRTRLEKLL